MSHERGKSAAHVDSEGKVCLFTHAGELTYLLFEFLQISSRTTWNVQSHMRRCRRDFDLKHVLPPSRLQLGFQYKLHLVLSCYRNGRDIHRELCGLYFLADGSMTLYEFRKFGKKQDRKFFMVYLPFSIVQDECLATDSTRSLLSLLRMQKRKAIRDCPHYTSIGRNIL